jgi:drug/metabolite transporter (DMT)-like permease
LTEKRVAVPIHPVAASLVQYSVGLAVVAPLAYFLEPMRVEWSWPLAGSLAYLVFGNSLLAISLFLAMIRYGEASRVSALFFLVPPTTAMIAFLVLGETLALFSLVGMAIAVAGIYVVMRKS